MAHVESLGTVGRQTAVTAALALSLGLAALGTSIANIGLPALAAAFSVPFAQVQAVVVGYLAALTASVVVAGRLGDQYGLRPMLVAGLAIFAGASLLCAVAPGLWILVGARVLQGVGAAFMMTLAMALMRQTAEEARIGRAMGLLGTVSALGTALGPSLGGLLISVVGWRGIFWVQVPLACVALLLALMVLPAGPGKQRTASAPRRTALPAGLVPNLIVNLLVAMVMMTTLVVGPFFLGLSLGLATEQVGLVMAIGPGISIISGVPSGRIVDAWGANRMLTVGLVLLTVGAVLLAFLPVMSGVAGYVLAIMVLTPGYQLFQAANTTTMLARVPQNQRGTASGLLGLSRNAGLIAGASAMGALFAFGVGDAEITQASAQAVAAGMQLTFLVASALMMLALGLVILPRLWRT